jgi:hypothetical protein
VNPAAAPSLNNDGNAVGPERWFHLRRFADADDVIKQPGAVL